MDEPNQAQYKAPLKQTRDLTPHQDQIILVIVYMHISALCMYNLYYRVITGNIGIVSG